MKADAEMKVRLSSAMKREIEAIADKRHQKMSVVVRDAIVEYVNGYKAEHPAAKPASVKPQSLLRRTRRQKSGGSSSGHGKATA